MEVSVSLDFILHISTHRTAHTHTSYSAKNVSTAINNNFGIDESTEYKNSMIISDGVNLY